jgi:hypothetical protein
MLNTCKKKFWFLVHLNSLKFEILCSGVPNLYSDNYMILFIGFFMLFVNWTA